MPVSDKRFITLVIQRSEKAKQSSDPADQTMTPETLSLACQLVKSTSVYLKYKLFIENHTQAQEV